MNRNTDIEPTRVPGAVLMADPHALVLDGLQRLIETEHRVVGSVSDGESLVSEARRLRPDLVVSEVQLPVLGGLDAARRVLAERPGTRMVFLTTVEDPLIAAQAFAQGAAGYILKSSTSEQFLDGLRAVLAGRRVLSPRLAGGDPDALRARGGATVTGPLASVPGRARSSACWPWATR